MQGWSRTRTEINVKGRTRRKYIFRFTQSWLSAKQAQIRRYSVNYDFDFLVDISKLI